MSLVTVLDQPSLPTPATSTQQYTAYQMAVLLASPSLYWPLNDKAGSSTVTDYSPNNLVGSVGSALTLGSASVVASDQRTSLGFPGGANAATKLISSSQNTVTQPTAALTLEWVGKLSALPSAALFWFGCGVPASGGAGGYCIVLNTNGTLTFNLSNGAGTLTSTALAVGTQYHIACTYDGTTMRIYVNGIQNASVAYSAAITSYNGSVGFFCGDNYVSRAASVNGLTQDVALFTYALPSSLIASHAKIAAGYVNSAYEQAVLSSSPALFWPLGDAAGNTTVKDYGPNGLNGTVGSVLALGSSALLGNDPTTSSLFPAAAYSSGRTISAPVNSALQPTTAFTFECIFRFISAPTNYAGGGIFFLNSSTASTSAFSQIIQISTGNVINVVLNNGAISVNSTVALIVGQTYHIAVTYNSANIFIYVNGVLAGSTAYTSALANYGNGPLLIGNSYTSAPGTLLGCNIEGAAYYSTALSAASILNHAQIAGFTSTSNGNTAYEQTVLASKPSLYWPLGDTVGSATAIDVSGNGLNGVVGSAVTLGNSPLVPSDPRRSSLLPGGSYAATKNISSVQSALLQPSAYCTVEWVGKVVTMPSASVTWFSVGANTSTPVGIGINLNTNGTILFAFNAGSQLFTSATSLVVGVTYHIACTYDGVAMRIYINGILNASNAYTGAITGYDGTDGFSLGDKYAPRTTAPNVVTQDVAFYTTALSAGTVNQHANLALGNTVYEQTVLASNPALYWPLGDSVGSTTVRDLGPNNLPGTLGSSLALGNKPMLFNDPTTSVNFPGGAYAATKQVTAPLSGTLQPTTAFSCECVVELTAMPTGNQLVWTNSYSSSTTGASQLLTIFNDGHVQAALNTGAVILNSAAGVITAGPRYHIVVTYNSVNLVIYVNGLQVASLASTVALSAYGYPFVAGDSYSSRTGEGGMLLSQLAYYTTTLSPASILQHYQIAFQEYLTPYDQGPAKSDFAVITDTVNNNTDSVTATDTRAAISDSLSLGWSRSITDTRASISDSGVGFIIVNHFLVPVDTKPSISDSASGLGTYFVNLADARLAISDSISLNHNVFAVDTKPSLGDSPTFSSQRSIALNDIRAAISDSTAISNTVNLQPSDILNGGYVAGYSNGSTTISVAMFNSYTSVQQSGYNPVYLSSPGIAYYIQNGLPLSYYSGTYYNSLTHADKLYYLPYYASAAAIGIRLDTVVLQRNQVESVTDSRAVTSDIAAFTTQRKPSLADIRASFSDSAVTLNEVYPVVADSRTSSDSISLNFNLYPIDTAAPYSDNLSVVRTVNVIASDTAQTKSDSVFVLPIFHNVNLADTRADTGDQISVQIVHDLYVVDTRNAFSDQVTNQRIRNIYLSDTLPGRTENIICVTADVVTSDTRSDTLDKPVLFLSYTIVATENLNLLDDSNLYFEAVATQLPIDTRDDTSDSLYIAPMEHDLAPVDSLTHYNLEQVATGPAPSYAPIYGEVLVDPQRYDVVALPQGISIAINDARSAFSDIAVGTNPTFEEVQRAYGFTDGLLSPLEVSFTRPPVPGNLMVAFSVGTVNATPPDGWTLIASVAGAQVEGSVYSNAVAFARQVQVGDPVYTNFNVTPIGSPGSGFTFPTCLVMVEYQNADMNLLDFEFSPTADCSFNTTTSQMSGISSHAWIPKSAVLALFTLYVPGFAPKYIVGSENIDSGFKVDLAQISNEKSGYGQNVFLVGQIEHIPSENVTIAPTATFGPVDVLSNPQQSAFMLTVKPRNTALTPIDVRPITDDTNTYFAPVPHSITATPDTRASFKDTTIVIRDALGFIDAVLPDDDTRADISDTALVWSTYWITPVDTRAPFVDSNDTTSPTFPPNIFTQLIPVYVKEDYNPSLDDSNVSLIAGFFPVAQDDRAPISDSVYLFDAISFQATDTRATDSNGNPLVQPNDVPAVPMKKNVNQLEDYIGSNYADFARFRLFPPFPASDSKDTNVSDNAEVMLIQGMIISDSKLSLADSPLIYIVKPYLVYDTLAKSDSASCFIVPLVQVKDDRATTTDLVAFTYIRQVAISDSRVFGDIADAFLSFLRPLPVVDSSSPRSDYLPTPQKIKNISLTEFHAFNDRLTVAGGHVVKWRFINITDRFGVSVLNYENTQLIYDDAHFDVGPNRPFGPTDTRNGLDDIAVLNAIQYPLPFVPVEGPYTTWNEQT